MKKLILSSIIVIITIALSVPSFAQSKVKFGHINSNELMELIPGRDSAQKALESYAKSLEDQLKIMTDEFQQKYSDYTANESSYIEPVKQSKQKELVDMQNRIQEFQNQAQSLLSKREAELIQPIIDKAKKAIEEVAKEKGFTYIFDVGTGNPIFWDGPGSEDILPLVKTKMGIK